MIDIRTHIYARVFGQCLKLLHPDIAEPQERDDEGNLRPTDNEGNPRPTEEFVNFSKHFPPAQYVSYNSTKRSGIILTDKETDAISEVRYMNEVKVTGINILNLESNPMTAEEKSNAPAILIDFGGGEHFDEHVKLDSRVNGEALAVIIRLILPREKLIPSFMESNAIQTAKVRGALDFLLDPNMFRSYAPSSRTNQQGTVVVSGRPGYDVGSRIIDIMIKSSIPLGVVRDKYMTDFLFIANFYQQKERGESYAVNDQSP